MADENIKIVEINGVKIEVDLRNAKVISNFKVGDKVKLLRKEYSKYESCPGIIVGFDDYISLPTIIVAYLKLGYGTAEISYAYINSQSEEFEITTSNVHEISFSKDEVIRKIDSEILSYETKIKEANMKKELFLTQFNKYFTVGEV